MPGLAFLIADLGGFIRYARINCSTIWQTQVRKCAHLIPNAEEYRRCRAEGMRCYLRPKEPYTSDLTFEKKHSKPWQNLRAQNPPVLESKAWAPIGLACKQNGGLWIPGKMNRKTVGVNIHRDFILVYWTPAPTKNRLGHIERNIGGNGGHVDWNPHRHTQLAHGWMESVIRHALYTAYLINLRDYAASMAVWEGSLLLLSQTSMLWANRSKWNRIKNHLNAVAMMRIRGPQARKTLADPGKSWELRSKCPMA